MRETRHLIIGSGMAGHAAAAAIREREPDAAVTMLGNDPERPYARPPLSKGLWFGKPEESVWLPDVPGLVLLAGRRAIALDPVRREVHDDRGEVHRYERLLLATGGVPRQLPQDAGRVVYLRTLADQRRIRAAGRRAVVIGAGFIGSEIAAALAASGREVTMVFPEPAIGARTFPADLAEEVTRTFRARGVRILAGEAVAAVEARGDETIVHTARGERLAADAVVAGLGIRPDVSLAEMAGLRCSDGIEVDASLETSAPGVFAAGDVARFPCAALGAQVRVEHEDAAITMGRTAGGNMAGAGERYDHLPFFYSDLFDLGYEAVGRIDARLATLASWRVPFREGIVCYLEEGRVRGVLLWGIFGKTDAARALVAGRVPPEPTALAAALAP